MCLKTYGAKMPNSISRTDDAHPLFLGPSPTSHSRSMRVAFYSHDTMGMGHIRRNLLIASSLVKNCPNLEALLVAGTREAAYFASQSGLDCVTLPALAKNADGAYASRHLACSYSDAVRMRSRIIAATIEAFAPDVLVVDKVPRGIGNELVATLEALRGTSTRCILGLRDILDEPEVVASEWVRDGNEEAIEAYYDELWIYGDRSIYDCVTEYQFGNVVSSRAYFTGYLNQTDRVSNDQPVSRTSIDQNRKSASREKTVLCVVGGGQDGFELARAFVESTIPEGWRGILITGPFMPKPQMDWLRAASNAQIEIIDRLVEADQYLSGADRVIAMGGYNTVMSILSFAKPALLVPRVKPRKEQWIRAERLADRGWLTAIAPDRLSHSTLTDWMHSPDVPTPSEGIIDMQGLDRIGQRVRSFHDHGAKARV